MFSSDTTTVGFWIVRIEGRPETGRITRAQAERHAAAARRLRTPATAVDIINVQTREVVTR